jgi:hypothetical protein
MTRIIGYEKALDILGQFQFCEFVIVRELRFYENPTKDSGQMSYIDLLVETENRPRNYQLKLTFSGVSNFMLRDFGGVPTRIVGLDIINVTDRQLEGIFWEIVDFEDGDLGFCAATAEIVSVSFVASE